MPFIMYEMLQWILALLMPNSIRINTLVAVVVDDDSDDKGDINDDDNGDVSMYVCMLSFI